MMDGNFGINSGNYGDEGRNVAVGVLAGLGVGLLVGAAAALLLTPTSGEEVRNEVGKSMTDLTDKIDSLIKESTYWVNNAGNIIRKQMAHGGNDTPSDTEEAAG